MVIIINVFILTSCATGYQDASNPFNFTGGYGLEKGPGKLDKIFFIGNGYTSVKRANQYALRRAAELGQKQSKRFFCVYQTLTDAANDRKAREPLTDIRPMGKPLSYFYVDYHDKKEPGDYTIKEVLDHAQK
jgi:hypothetical protein